MVAVKSIVAVNDHLPKSWGALIWGKKRLWKMLNHVGNNNKESNFRIPTLCSLGQFLQFCSKVAKFFPWSVARNIWWQLLHFFTAVKTDFNWCSASKKLVKLGKNKHVKCTMGKIDLRHTQFLSTFEQNLYKTGLEDFFKLCHALENFRPDQNLLKKVLEKKRSGLKNK